MILKLLIGITLKFHVTAQILYSVYIWKSYPIRPLNLFNNRVKTINKG